MSNHYSYECKCGAIYSRYLMKGEKWKPSKCGNCFYPKFKDISGCIVIEAQWEDDIDEVLYEMIKERKENDEAFRANDEAFRAFRGFR